MADVLEAAENDAPACEDLAVLIETAGKVASNAAPFLCAMGKKSTLCTRSLLCRAA